MKKILLPLLLSCIVSFTFGQSLKKANSYLNDKNLEKAKTEIDEFLVKNPADAEGLYIKSKIYGKIADSAQLREQIGGDPRGEAFEAFKKAAEDSNNLKIKLMIMKDNYQPIFDIYAGYYEEAANEFNKAAQAHSKEDFTKSMELFIKSNNTGQYIAENKWAKIGKIDTTLVLNIGKAALNAGNNEEALKYFTELADAKISGLHGVEDPSFEIPYQWLLLHYKEAKDETNMLKYAAYGNELFPNDGYYNLVLIDYYREKKDYPGLFKIYDNLVTAHPDSIHYHFNYANDIFGYLYNSDEGVVVTNKVNLLKTLHTEIEKAHAIDSSDVNTNWLYSQYYYNLGIEARDSALKIRSTKPEDVKRKADFNATAKANFNTAIPYGEKALAKIEMGYLKEDKSKFKSIDNLMQNIYQSLEQKDKLKFYQDKYDQADAKFVN